MDLPDAPLPDTTRPFLRFAAPGSVDVELVSLPCCDPDSLKVHGPIKPAMEFDQRVGWSPVQATLQAEPSSILSAGLYQFLVCAIFRNNAIVDHDNAID